MSWNLIVNIMILLAQACPLVYSGKVSPNKINRMSCRNEATFKANGTNFVVKESSSKLNATINAQLLPHCARSCIKANGCRSVIYKKKSSTAAGKNCQLLNVEKIDLTSNDIQSSPGWMYYEPLQQGTSRCQPDTCEAGYECVETCSPSIADQYSCKAFNSCDSNPCTNGATCVKVAAFYKCACSSGYLGHVCDILHTSSLTSQNYPSNYPNSHSQTWTLSVPSGRLVIYFFDFQAESCCDKVELRDGSSASSPLIAIVSGTSGKYKNYFASGSHIYVKFRTDGSIAEKGFGAYIGSA